MATLSAPSPQPVSASFGANRKHRPLSTHGMPKEPRSMSLERPHRFSGLDFPSPSFASATMSPRSPIPMSPPMSAKSFGTFIDSEPSTPAYSPRMDHDWDSSTLVLLRPMSSSSEPSTPTEPVWDMMTPMKLPQKSTKTAHSKASFKASSITTKEISTGTSLSPHLVKQPKPARPLKEIRVVDLSQRENDASRKEEIGDITKDKLQGEQNSDTGTAPLGKLASKMKWMLRRKSTTDKKKQKKEKDYYDVDRMDDVHWTEM